MVCLTFCEDKEKLKNDVILETESTAKVVLGVIHCVLLISYKESFTRLRSLKTEIEHLQHLLEKAKVKMQKDFEIWWAEQASFNQVYTESIRSVWCVFSSTSTGTISRHNLTPWGLEELVTTGAQRSVCVCVRVSGRGGGWGRCYDLNKAITCRKSNSEKKLRLSTICQCRSLIFTVLGYCTYCLLS